MHKVVIKGEVLSAADEMLLSDLLIQSGKAVEHPCGGRGVCKKCTVFVDGKEALSCQYTIRSDISVSFLHSGTILSETGAMETGELTENLCYALDIGTTTLALALVSLDEGKIIRVITRTNPQRIFGADVMTRIGCCRKNGAQALHAALISEVNDMIAEFALPQVEKLYASGNTTMLHLFFDVDCSAMGAAPYHPAFLESKCEIAGELGIIGAETVISLPSIAAFVGADLVAGLNYVGLPEKGKHRLLIDLGTNAEIILFSQDSILCTAAAAGPCFEGANISCGMSATAGAICAYAADGSIKTVADAPAKGICGTGLVDVIAELTGSEAIDETGFMECGSFEIADGVRLNQGDVRQFQLAKSAVFSAVLTLMKMQGVSFEEMEKMYISGGFSAKINIANAVKTGLLPKELMGKCAAVNNSSLLGTVKYACENNDLSVYLKNARYVDLSGNADFSALFVENMLFETE